MSRRTVATIEMADGAKCIIIADRGGYEAYFDGGTWPDGDRVKVFARVSEVMSEVAEVVELSYLEMYGGDYEVG